MTPAPEVVSMNTPIMARRTGRGFSLLEVTFAASIMLMGLASTAGVYNMVGNSFGHQKDMAIATGIGESFLEQVVILPQTSPLLEVGSHPTRFFNAEGRRLPTDSTSRFEMTWEVTANEPVAGIKEVVVEISWQGQREHHIEFFTYRE
jgi:hypothetical protein